MVTCQGSKQQKWWEGKATSPSWCILLPNWQHHPCLNSNGRVKFPFFTHSGHCWTSQHPSFLNTKQKSPSSALQKPKYHSLSCLLGAQLLLGGLLVPEEQHPGTAIALPYPSCSSYVCCWTLAPGLAHSFQSLWLHQEHLSNLENTVNWR